MTFVAFAAAVVLGAASAPIDCKDPLDQYAINMCAAKKATEADARLNAVYSRYRRRLVAEQQKQLTKAQREWRAFRTSWCGFIASGVEGGTVHPFVVSSCFVEVTEERIKQLEGVSACEGRDLDCPSNRTH
jgi:uncharacterized protein YecT (DUF1311 family)